MIVTSNLKQAAKTIFYNLHSEELTVVVGPSYRTCKKVLAQVLAMADKANFTLPRKVEVDHAKVGNFIFIPLTIANHKINGLCPKNVIILDENVCDREQLETLIAGLWAVQTN